MEIKKDEAGNDIEPTAEEFKAELARIEAEKAKIEEERENYKKGLLEREEKLKALKTTTPHEQEDEEEESAWDEASKKFQNETLSKATKTAEEAVTKVIETKNEKQGIAEFLESHPEVTDEVWQKVVANYNPVSGKDSAKSVIKDIERAYVLYKFDAGETINPEEIRKTEAMNNIKTLQTNGGQAPSGRYEENNEQISDGQLSIAERMRVSKDALAKEDDTLSAEIKIA